MATLKHVGHEIQHSQILDFLRFSPGWFIHRVPTTVFLDREDKVMQRISNFQGWTLADATCVIFKLKACLKVQGCHLTYRVLREMEALELRSDQRKESSLADAREKRLHKSKKEAIECGKLRGWTKPTNSVG